MTLSYEVISCETWVRMFFDYSYFWKAELNLFTDFSRTELSFKAVSMKLGVFFCLTWVYFYQADIQMLEKTSSCLISELLFFLLTGISILM